MKARWLVSFRRRSKILFDLVGTDAIRRNALKDLPFWIASLITGLVAVAFTKLFGYSEDILQKVLHWHMWMIFILAPTCFLLAWLVVQLFAPNAKGSGIPQVMAAI